MLRAVIGLAAAIFLVMSLWGFTQDATAWPALVAALILFVGTLFERFYYRGSAPEGAGGPWKATGERFLDEESGRLVTVWYNPMSGERRYVEGDAPEPVVDEEPAGAG